MDKTDQIEKTHGQLTGQCLSRVSTKGYTTHTA
ncbi:hypothetical protein F383_00629 [Gossypium arboreum]|uniref:Uncharacterized protein n=1 Tax=Gossypium arboreum TaxID=29729 RepID=A0A0B0NGE2_GOSAR|nr:hypothetical protein F383_00629 [Gossypium arboreum]